MKLNISTQGWYVIILTTLTAILFVTYAYVYFVSTGRYGKKYIPLITTTRILVIAAFLLYFYNPLRSKFEYGHALPVIAFSAGISLLLLVNRDDIHNLVYFILYGELIPENPKKVCRLENVDNAEVEVPKKIQQEILPKNPV